MSFWSWWILAAVLAGIEILAPGAFFIWLSGAAIVTGLIVGALGFLGWEAQGIIFATSSVASLILWRIYLRNNGADASTLNRRGAQLLGRHGVLTEAIVGGRGKIRIDDTLWIATGPELATGTPVAVISVDGAVLEVMQEHPESRSAHGPRHLDRIPSRDRADDAAGLDTSVT